MDRPRPSLKTDPTRPDVLEATADRPPDEAERVLWAHFVQAADGDGFLRAWLALQCRMLAGVSAGLVLLGPPDRGPYAAAARWPADGPHPTHLAPPAERALHERRALLMKHEPAARGSGAPQVRYAVAYPVMVAERLHGVVVLDVAARPEPELQGVLRQLHWGAAWLEVFVRRQPTGRDAGAPDRLKAVLELVAAGAGHERFYAAAAAFASTLATRLECDRVSLGFVRGGRVRVRAVSHSAQFAKHANIIRAIAEAMEEALDQHAAVVYPAPDGAGQVTRAHAELARQFGAGAICSIPLAHAGRALGVLTLERPADRPFDPATVELCEAVAALAGPLLDLQRRDDRWLITKAAEACGTQLGHLIGPRHIPLKLGAAAAAAAVAFAVLAHGEYRVTGKMALEPTLRRAAVAPFNGYIAQAPARAGDVVRRGQVLAALDDRELKLEHRKAASQVEQLRKQHQQALAARNAAQVEILAAQIAQAQAQLALVADQLGRVRVVAPFDGVIVEGDLTQSLGAPVERGKVLFEVAPLDAYRAILQVDERDVADVAVGRKGQLVLAAFPDDPLPFTVEQVTPVSTAREGRNYFRVEARLDATPGGLRPGMEGVGKVEAGRRRQVLIWTRPIVDWVRLTLWTWLP